MSKGLIYTVAIFSILLLIIATGDNEYGYYQFLRVAITATAGITAYNFYEAEKIGFSYLFGAIALLFNPIFPVYMEKESWILFDWLAAIVFAVGAFYAASITSTDET